MNVTNIFYQYNLLSTPKFSAKYLFLFFFAFIMYLIKIPTQRFKKKNDYFNEILFT